MNNDTVKAAADQAAASADETARPVTVGADEWFALLDAIYDEGGQDEEDES